MAQISEIKNNLLNNVAPLINTATEEEQTFLMGFLYGTSMRQQEGEKNGSKFINLVQKQSKENNERS